MVRVRVGVRVHRTDDTWLGLRCRRHVGVTVSVLSIRQGRVRVTVRVRFTARRRSGYPEGCAQPEMEVIHARDPPIDLVRTSQ